MPNPCPCATLFPNHIDKTIGHVRGLGTDILPNGPIKNIMKMGLNAKIPTKDDKATVYENIHKYLKIINATLVKNKVHKKQRAAVRAKFKSMALCAFPINKEQPLDLNLSLKHYHEHLLFSKTDKASNLICYECINYHRLQLSERVNTENFKSTAGDADTAAAAAKVKVKRYLRMRLGWIHEFEILPSFACITTTTKLHKSPIDYRFLTPTQNTAYAPVAILIGQILRFLLWEIFPQLCEKREAEIAEQYGVQVKLMWAINRMNDFLLSLPAHVHTLYGADIEKCYERPPLTDDSHSLLNALCWFVDKCFKHANHGAAFKAIWYKLQKNGNPSDKKYVTVIGFDKPKTIQQPLFYSINDKTLKHLIKFQLSNLFIRLGNKVFRQTIGFGMGLHSSSDECDIYFIRYEFSHVERALVLGALWIAELSLQRYRYQDDLTAINDPTMPVLLNPSQVMSDDNPLWIYPLHLLTMKHTNVIPPAPVVPGIVEQITFLSARLTTYINCGTLKSHIEKYNKMEELPFYNEIPKYSHKLSTVPYHILFNPIHSQLTTIAYTCSSLDILVIEALKLVWILLDNGLSESAILKNLHKWSIAMLPYLPLKYFTDTFISQITGVLGWS
jgi:hypothetical protein